MRFLNHMRGKAMRNFEFGRLVARYGEQTAVVSDQQAYSYRRLADLAQTVRQQAHWQARYVVLVAQPDVTFITQFLAIHLAGRIPVIVNKADVAQVPQVLAPIAGTWQWLTDQDQPDAATTNLNPRGLLFLGLTSGTTGQPKVYQRDWSSWRVGFDQCQMVFDMAAITGVMTTSPLGTSLGLHTLLLSLYLGKTFYCFQRGQSLTLPQPTQVFTVPTYLAKGHDAWAAAPGIMSVVTCGGELSAELVQTWHRQHPQHQLYELYGTSETSLVAWQALTRGKQPQQVGHLFPQVQAAIMPDSQQLVVRSPYLFAGYLGDATAVYQVMTDDVARLDGDGLLILSRASDVMNHGGNKIYPSEIEQILQPMVTTCVVFGVPDAVYGENIVALLVTTTPITTIKAVLQAHLPTYKLPSQYLVVADIPKTTQGKVSRAQLAAQYQAGKWS